MSDLVWWALRLGRNELIEQRQYTMVPGARHAEGARVSRALITVVHTDHKSVAPDCPRHRSGALQGRQVTRSASLVQLATRSSLVAPL